MTNYYHNFIKVECFKQWLNSTRVGDIKLLYDYSRLLNLVATDGDRMSEGTSYEGS